MLALNLRFSIQKDQGPKRTFSDINSSSYSQVISDPTDLWHPAGYYAKQLKLDLPVPTDPTLPTVPTLLCRSQLVLINLSTGFRRTNYRMLIKFSDVTAWAESEIRSQDWHCKHV